MNDLLFLILSTFQAPDEKSTNHTGSDQNNQVDLKADQNERETEQSRSSDSLKNLKSQLNESTGEKRYSSVREFEVEGREHEEIFVDLIEREE